MRMINRALKDGLKKYVNNASWLLFGRILRVTTSLLIGAWLARYLGPTQFGLLSFSQSLAAIFSALATMGITGILVRDLVRDDIERKFLLSTSLILMFLGATLSYFSLAIFLTLWGYDFDTNILIFIIGAATFFQISSVFECYFQSVVRAKYIVIPGIISSILSSLLKIILILSNAPLILFCTALVFDSLILFIGLLIYFLRDSNFILSDFRFSGKIARYLLKESWPYILSGILVSLYMKIDQVMIKEMMSDEAVGQYSAAVRISEAWYFIPLTIVMSLYPAIVLAKKKSEALYINRLTALYSILIYTSFVISVLVTFSSDLIINLFFGESYSQSARILVVHIWASLFVVIGASSGRWLLTEGLQFYSAINTFIGMVMNVTLNFVLIPELGLIGAAWATLISYSFSAYFCLSFWKKTRPNFLAITRSLFHLPIVR